LPNSKIPEESIRVKIIPVSLVLFITAAALLSISASQAISAKKRILEFPTSKTVARIYYCRTHKKNPNEIKIIMDASRPAVGTISIEGEQPIMLEVTWDGAEDLSWLSKLKADDVQVLDLHKLPISKKGLPHIAKLTGLKYLFLEDTELEDEDLKSVGRLSNLIELRLSKTAVKGAGLRYLNSLKKLEKLNLGYLELDEKSLPQLKNLSSLKDLDLGNCGLKDTAIKSISGIAPLHILSLRSNKHLSDKKLGQLSSLKKLWNINLADTNVSSNVGKELKSFPSLRMLKLGGGKAAPLDVAAIQKQLPGCRIVLVDNKDEFAKKIFSPLH